MKDRYELGYEYACYLWRRPDLEAKPRDIKCVAEVLMEAGIEVYSIEDAGFLVCQPRPGAVWEALTGEFWTSEKAISYKDYIAEQPGCILNNLSSKSEVRILFSNRYQKKHEICTV